MNSKTHSPRFTTFSIFSAAILLRAGFFFYGLFQDAYSPIKYTDIDYYVFTDAARFVSQGQSPYQRDTYRYTPLLAWLLLPSTWSPSWFHFGKIVFSIGDIVAGWLIVRILRGPSSSDTISQHRALRYASLWLLNPMVAAISTRGSSEGLLGVIVMGLLWAVVQQRITLAGVLLGFAVHFKIYPFIYGVSIIWWLDEKRVISLRKTETTDSQPGIYGTITKFLNPARIKLGVTSLTTFLGLNAIMYQMHVCFSSVSLYNKCHRLMFNVDTDGPSCNIHTSIISRVLTIGITSPCIIYCSTSIRPRPGVPRRYISRR